MRVSLEQARKESDADLKHQVCPPQAAYSTQAFDLFKAFAIGAPPTTPAMVRDWGHADASYWAWASEAHKGAFEYNEVKLLAACTMGAAEFEVSRSRPCRSTEEHIFKMRVAANGRVVGYWRGGQLGAIGSLYEAAAANGATFGGTSALRECWGNILEVSPIWRIYLKYVLLISELINFRRYI